jgi:hypothetical protein
MSSELLQNLWGSGYSIAELWGFTAPVSRGTSEIAEPHCLLWGILGIVEYQVDKGAGHRYLQARIASGDWVGIGFCQSDEPEKRLAIVPKIKNAKFGRKKSAVGDDAMTFTDVRFVHQKLYAEALAADGQQSV